MRVIIPAAGYGKRFVDAGYTQPKPLVPVCGSPMLAHVLRMVRKLDSSPIVLCRAEDQAAIAQQVHGCKLLPLSYVQQGAALTVLSANLVMADDEAVTVVDCDNIVETPAFDAFANFAILQAQQGAGAILTTRVTENGAWAYVATQRERVLRVAEKVPISNRVTCGAYAFPSWAALRQAICTMVAAEDDYNGEYYLAPAYNYLAHTAACFDMPLQYFHCVGTPEQLKAYEEAHTCA